MKFEQEFKEWLPKNDVESKSSYGTYVRNAQKSLEVNSIEDFFNDVITKAIDDNFVEEKFGEKKKASDSKSAVKKYWEFLKAKMEQQ